MKTAAIDSRVSWDQQKEEKTKASQTAARIEFAREENAWGSTLVEPQLRFQGQPGEQATSFFLDPTGNALEFKGFRDISKQLFDTGR